MSTSQTRPATPPSEYGPSLTPPTLEEINLCHVSVDVEPSENNNGSPPPATEENVVVVTEEAKGDKASDQIGTCGLITIYLGLIVYAMFMAAVLIILIRLTKYSYDYESRSAALVIWGIVEFGWRFSAVYIAAKNYSATYTIFNSLGIFLGREYYVTLINSFWPDADPLDASVDQPGLRIDVEWTLQGTYYAMFNLIFGIWFWVVTLHAVNHSPASDDYEKSLAAGGLVSCLVNVITYVLLSIYGIFFL